MSLVIERAARANIAADFEPAVLKAIYETVVRITRSDDRLMKALQAGELKTIYYPVRGQEIIPAAAVAALNRSDYMVTTYRCLHDVIAKGVPLLEIMAEFLGRSAGASKGKGGNMHISHLPSGLMATTGIVGAGAPIGNGLALASKMRGGSEITLVMFGDGATSIGAVHEALNMAALWSLPVIFLIQNNQYGEHTAPDGYTKSECLSARAVALGMRGVTIDGNDAVAVYAAVAEAARLARAGEGPTLLECMTYRLRGHTASATTAYMDEATLKLAWANDPVPQLRAMLVDWGVATEGELQQLETQIAEEVDQAYNAALASPPPDLRELCADVYADMTGIPQ